MQHARGRIELCQRARLCVGHGSLVHTLVEDGETMAWWDVNSLGHDGQHQQWTTTNWQMDHEGDKWRREGPRRIGMEEGNEVLAGDTEGKDSAADEFRQ